MSVVLPNLDFVTTPAVVGVRTLYDFSTIVQTGVNPLQIDKYGQPKLQFLNESPVGMQIQLAQSLKSYNIAAGEWGSLDIDADDKGFYWTPQYILLPNPAVNLMLLTYLPPGDPGTTINVLGNSPIQGVAVITNTTAQFLQGIGQTLSVTELDDGTGNPIVLPTNGANQSLFLGVRDATNTPRVTVELGSNHATAPDLQLFRPDASGLYGSFSLDTILLTGAVQAVNSKFTVGNFGVPVIVADAFTSGIVSTALQTVTVYTPASFGYFRLNCTIRIANGTSGNNITAQVKYIDAFVGGTITSAFTCTDATTSRILGGAVSTPNNVYSTMALSFFAAAGQPIQFLFRDPTNTPNDTYFVFLEQLN